MRRVRVVISGKVQGVGFRWICAQEAKDRGITGFVRNLSDGRVEAAFEGEDGAVAGIREWAEHGPKWAEVTGIETHEEPPRGDQDFEILG